jgi:glucosyl-3-phosphoglycerate synthase
MSVLSPVVEAWCSYRSSHAGAYPPEELAAVKGATTVSVVLPARDEAATVGAIVRAIAGRLQRDLRLVDEVIVVDSRSTDGTADVARAAGATVVDQDGVTRGLPPMAGKGDAMWAGLAASTGDLVVFADADVEPFDPRYVTGLLGPLLTDPSVDFVKGYYHRPLRDEPDGGGRVTELVARPLLNLFWPHLAGFVQPLAGETAGRRDVLSRVPFVTGYGVELALLVDLLHEVGLDALAQVDLGERAHRHQDTAALGRMAAQIQRAAWSRLVRHGRAAGGELPGTLTQFRRDGDRPVAALDRDVVVSDVSVQERPPLVACPPLGARAE